MKGNILAIFLLLSVQVFGQTKPQSLGNCSSYKITGNHVVFNCDNKAKVLLQLCSGQVIKVWVSAEGNFKRNNESFAVVNEKLADIGTINLNDETAAYEIFTDQLRIRVNKSPFKLQIFDKYQKLLFSDFNERGFVKENNRITAYKTLRADEQFFGLGEKAGPINRRGRSYKMWNSDNPCYGVNEDPLYKSIPFFMSSYRYGVFFDNTYIFFRSTWR
jgi:alpha-glucosidase